MADPAQALPVQPQCRPLVDVAGLAAYLQVSAKTVRRMVDERRIPFLQIPSPGRRALYRFDLDAVNRALQPRIAVADQQVQVDFIRQQVA